MTKNEFEEVVDKNKDSIWRICRMYVPEKDRCKDLYQDVLVQIWRSLPSFQGRSTIETWIYRITVNTCIKASLKIRRYEKELSLDQFEMKLYELPEGEKERYEALYICIGRLGAADKTLIGLFLEERPYKEIAEILGLTENHVAVKLSRIKKALQVCLEV